MPKPELFFVTPELQQVLDSLPPGAPRSKLDPLRPFILRWRRQGRGYRQIQQILRDECRMKASLSTLFHFVETRSKPRRTQPDIDLEPPTAQPVNELPPATKAAAINKNSDQSSDPYAEARERMRKHKETPAVRKPKPLFPVYTDEELLEPHVLNPKTKEEN
jgi:hypothetical protein